MKASVYGFQKIKKAEVDIEGFVLVLGPTHSGKSSFIRAVQSALYNSPPKDFVREGSNYSEVTLAARRPWTWSKASGPTTIYIGDDKYDKIGRSTPIELLSQIGFQPVVVDGKEFYPHFQEQLSDLFGLGESGTTLFSLVLAFSSYDKIPDVRKTVEQDLKKATEKRTKLEGSVEYLKEVSQNQTNAINYFKSGAAKMKELIQLDQLQTKRKELEELRDRIIEVRNLRTSAAETLYQLESEVKDLERVSTRILLKDEFQYFLKRKESLGSLGFDLETNILDLTNKALAIQQERTRVDNLFSLKDRLRHVFNVKGRLLVAQSLLSNINEFDVKVSEIEASQKRYQSLMFLYTRIRTTANQRVVASRDAMETVSLMDAVKQELSAFKLCPECGAPVREGKYTQVKL